MRLCRSSILISSCLIVGFNPGRIFALETQMAPALIKLAQTNPTPNPDTNQRILRPGNSGTEVKALQTKLKQLGFYTGNIDGDYGVSTRIAVSRFQAANSLQADGILGSTTSAKLDTVVAQKAQPTPTPTPSPTANNVRSSQERGLFWWGLVGLGLIGTLGAIAYFIRLFSKPKPNVDGDYNGDYKIVNTEALTSNFVESPAEKLDPKTLPQLPPQKQAVIQDFEPVVEPIIEQPIETSNASHDSNKASTELIASETTRLAKVNIVDELVKDLRSSDPNKRRKAIWDLGQQGDSRAIQPLVDLMIDADSQQRSLILAALSEIGTRTLKPMNRALAMSLQDESPEVRQNAIRDLTRVYDMMTQLSQMLYHATHDHDANVQATAKYALSQMNKIRSVSQDALPEK
ncbi:MAG: HEAT repeat domain-containing protein [Calothrix sp. C42_A2020_038]|nr:HEAT repeat domain-containing protein [Calothrix sp. C42_A2020_038]